MAKSNQSKPNNLRKKTKRSKTKDAEKVRANQLQSKPKDPPKLDNQGKPKDPAKKAKQSKPKDPEAVIHTETTSKLKENKDQVTPSGLEKSVPTGHDKQTKLHRLDNKKNSEELNICK